MYTETFIQEYVKFAGYINSTFHPWLLLIQGLWVLTLTVMITSIYVNYSTKKDHILKWIVGLIQCYGGIYMMLGHNYSTQMALLGVGFIPFGILFIFLFNKLDMQFKVAKERWLQIIGAIFMVSGLYFYQVIGMFAGFEYPNTVLFGVECPAYIFMGGLFIACMPTMNRYFMLIFFLYSFISSTSAIRAGAVFDWAYLSSAVAGLIITVKYWQIMGPHKKKVEPAIQSGS